MRVGFGCTLLAKGLSQGGVDGIGSYTQALGRQLATGQSVNLFPISFGVPVAAEMEFSAQAVQVLPNYAPMAVVSACTPFPFVGSGQLAKRVELFHATDHLVPEFAALPVVATLMDAVPLAHPEWIRGRLASVKSKLWRRTAQWADHILTISEYSKSDIIKYFGISAEKITVIPLGVDARYFERIEATAKNEIVRRHGLPERFYLFVGTLQPRKNVARILAAHAALPLYLQKELPLVIVGRAGWGCDALVAQLHHPGWVGRVYWLDYLPDLEVRALMQTAQALVFPSLYEGFGLPVLEAFASGLPVITANTTALPEVAGQAAILVNPFDVAAISDAMRLIVEDTGMAATLAAAGLHRARQLNWAACAEQTLAVYRKLLT